MKRRLITGILILLGTGVFSQTLEAYKRMASDTSKESLLHFTMLNEFSRIANFNANGAIGNYVGFGTDKNNLSFQYGFVEGVNLIQLNVNGGMTDGITNVISNNKFNTGISGGITWHRVFRASTISLSYDVFEQISRADDQLTRERANLDRKYKLDLEYKKLVKDTADARQKWNAAKEHVKFLIRGEPLPHLDAELYAFQSTKLERLKTEVDFLKAKEQNFSAIKSYELRILRTKRDTITNTNPLKQEQFEVDSLQLLERDKEIHYAIKKKENAIRKLKIEIAKNKYSEDKMKEAEAERDQALADFKAAKKQLAWYNEHKSNIYEYAIIEHHESRLNNFKKLDKLRAEEINLVWTSASFSLGNENFSLFDPALAFDQQVYKENDIVVSIGGAFSWYINKKRENCPKSEGRNISFFNIGLEAKYGNNSNELTQVNIETIDSIAPNRMVVKSQKAYQGTYEEGIASLKLNLDYYQFIGARDNVGFHFRGNITGMEGSRPVYSVRGGLLFATLKKDDQHSLANFEVFFGLNDIFKTGRENSLLERNVFGLQTTFPFNFKIK